VKRGKGLRALSRAIDATKGRPADEARDEIAALPLAGVLFLAMIGTPSERAEVDSPLVLVLDAIRDTIEGWARVPSLSTAYAYVPFGELNRLAHRVGAAAEIARRSVRKIGDGPRAEKRCQFTIIDADARARVCGKPATSTLAVDGVDLKVCDGCATWIAAQGRETKARREEAPR
jgi:hypothetical protein